MIEGHANAKNCLFCGSDNLSIWDNWIGVSVACLDCEATGPAKKDETEAVNAWNKGAK